MYILMQILELQAGVGNELIVRVVVNPILGLNSFEAKR